MLINKKICENWGCYLLTFIADSTLVNIFFRANKNQASAGSTTFDNISLKEVKHDFTVTSNATTTINTSNSNGYNNSSFSGNPLTGKFDLKVQTSGGDGGIVSRPFLFKAGRKYKVSFNYRIASGTKMRYKIANSPSSTTGANIKGLGYSPNDNLDSTSRELFEQEFIFSKQLALANQFKRPVSIHCRSSWDKLISLIDHLLFF